jgi:competence protein ComEA
MNLTKTLVTTVLALLCATSFAAVDVNKASPTELEAVKGIGPSMSARIVAARKAGAFKDWTDLQTRVKGVRAANATKFSADGLTVNGAAFSATAVAKADTRAVPAPKPAKAATAKK